MRPQFSEAWAALRAGHAAPRDGFRLQLLHGRGAIRIYAALSEEFLMPAVLVELPLQSLRTGTLSSKAFRARTASFDGLAPDRQGLLIELREAGFEDLFSTLAVELADAVLKSADARETVAGLTRVIDRWRRFVERSRAPLTDERVRGLLGELMVLSRLVSRLGGRQALLSWTGPQDALRDFELPDHAVEVKSLLSDSMKVVWINNLQQLEPIHTRPVFLVVVELTKTEMTGRTLPDLVDGLVQQVASEPDGDELLFQRLANYGYLSAHAHQYTDRFSVEQLRAFVVTEAFPRIPPQIVPSAVRDVRYSLELAKLDQFTLDPDALLGSAGTLERLAAHV
jgi:hypothetical protein